MTNTWKGGSGLGEEFAKSFAKAGFVLVLHAFQVNDLTSIQSLRNYWRPFRRTRQASRLRDWRVSRHPS